MKTLKLELSQLFATAVAQVIQAAGEAGQAASATIQLEVPKQAAHGDFSCNAAMQLAKKLGRPPRELAQALIAALPASPLVSQLEIAGAGFINVFLSHQAKYQAVHAALSQAAAYGLGQAGVVAGKAESVMVEFVSANPTGPLHTGHGRQAALGDAICRLLAGQGYQVYREFYYNDSGNQIANLTVSVQLRLRELNGEQFDWTDDAFKDIYKGSYVIEIAKDYRAAHSGDPTGANSDALQQFAVAYLRGEQDTDLTAFDLKFDHFYTESSLYTDGKVEEAVKLLVASGKAYEEGAALILRTTDYGDDKDRVMRKSDGTYTYFVPDVAYHISKFRRGFTRAVNIQGTDHFGTIARVRAGLQAVGLGIAAGYPDYVLHTMVKVMKGGEEVKVSKRAGDYFTLRDLIDEAGRDAVRFLLLMRKADTPMIFDIDIATKRSDENPVYGVQYAHARIAKLLREFAEQGGDSTTLAHADLTALGNPHEAALAAAILAFPELLETAAREFAPHSVVTYLMDLAGKFNSYYANDRGWLKLAAGPRAAKIALAAAVKQTLANGLAMLGVSAPESM